MTTRSKMWAVFVLFLFLAGCQQSVDLEAPPEILYGQDVCDECNMIINDPRFAAAYITADGEIRRFDDIGGMLSHDQKMGEAVLIYWVHDFNTEAWLNAQDASFVLNQDLATPMGWGIAAFAGESAAEAYVSEDGGALITYVALQEEIKTGTLDPSSPDHEQEMDQDASGE